MITRKRMRILATACRLAVKTGGHIFGKPLEEIADVLTTQTWFSAYELRLAADAMDILNMSQADAWTLRQRMDAFDRTGPMLKNAGSFAAYLQHMPNGGQE